MKVGAFEVPTHFQYQQQLFDCCIGFLILNQGEDLLSRNETACLVNDRVAHFSDKNHKTAGGIVVFRVLPDEH